jgi:hypothetical protein
MVSRTSGRVTAIVIVGVGAVVAVVAAGLALITGAGPLPDPPGCTARVQGREVTLTTEQSENAALIVALSVQRGMPARAASIALATAYQESKIYNIEHGDRDSLGLFQQRPSQGWGTAEQILDPEYATNRFYDALVKVDGYTDMDIAEAAQEVQRSAAGQAYAQHEAQARVTASVLSGRTTQGIGCALEDPEAAGDPEDLVALVDKDFAVPAQQDGSTVTVPVDSEELAWAVGSWAVARAADTGAVRVIVGDREWRRSMEESAFEWSATGDESGDPRTVTIHLA